MSLLKAPSPRFAPAAQPQRDTAPRISRLVVRCNDGVVVDRIRKAVVRPRWQVDVVGSWTEMTNALYQGNVDVLVLDPFASDGSLRPDVADVCARFPSLPIIAVFRPKVLTKDHIEHLEQWGVTDLLDGRMLEGVVALRKRIEAISLSPLHRMLLGEGGIRPKSAAVQALLSASVRTVTRAGRSTSNVGDLAKLLDCSQRTLLRRFQENHLPPPREVLKWVRVLWAASLLDDKLRPVLGVAQTVGYSSDTSLRRATQDHLKLSPNELREMGAWQTALGRFRDAIGH